MDSLRQKQPQKEWQPTFETAYNLLLKEKAGFEGDQTNKPANDIADTGDVHNDER
jgi:hypothetical protein